MKELTSVPPKPPKGNPGIHSQEQILCEGGKKVALLVAGVAHQKFGEALEEQQEITAAISDIIIEAFAMESVVLRAGKILARFGPDKAKPASKMSRLLVNSGVDRVEKRGRDALAAISTGEELKLQMVALQRLLARDSMDMIGLRREIARHVISEGKYLV
jgi:hypothetical protein